MKRLRKEGIEIDRKRKKEEKNRENNYKNYKGNS